MTPAIDHNTIAVVLYWLLMAPIAAYILHVVAGFCTDDYPTSFRSALGMILVTAAVVFFAFDLSSYVFALWMRDPSVGVRMPANYSYWDWLREPLAVKWHVLGFVPFVRFLPVFFALIAGCITQIFLWKVDFKLGAVVFVAQALLTFAAMELLSLIFRFGLQYYEHYVPPNESPAAVRPGSRDRNSDPADLQELDQRIQDQKSDPSSFWRRLDSGWESANGHLQPMYTFLEPVTKHLPHPAQSFLNAGGWLLVFAGLGGFVVFWPKIKRDRKEMLRPKSKRKPIPKTKLAMIGDSVTALGERQATVNGIPARLRHIIMVAPAGVAGKGATPTPVAQFLDTIRPDLSALSAADYPKADVWSDSNARANFRKTLETRIEFSEQSGQPSPWLILHGPVKWSGSTVQVALAFLLSKPTAGRIIELTAVQWKEAIGARTVPKEERD
jgi:hypothetical protein